MRTIAENTADLIRRLVAEATPVRRLRPPALRAGLWLLAVTSTGGLAILLMTDLAAVSGRAANPWLALEWFATLATGVAAILAAFALSLPDRSAAWALLPVPPFLVWIGSSGYSCFRNWVAVGSDGWRLGESANCFLFILAFSIPMALSLLPMLRRAHPLEPVRVAALGALGVAALAACALQFFHPFDVTFLDLSVHLGTVALVIAAVAGIEYSSRGRRA